MEPDYKMALLLQRQFEQENKTHQTDLHLAQMLQDNFNTESSTEKPVGLIYDTKKKSDSDARSLVDPSWEVIDPTPDIHNLFIAFSQQFFWNKLLTVCVLWSKRMTTCAGICSYQRRGGFCSITLSEPLLKLRPRKDLVETLLHEMIHAYLFVTHNNRDRDGHGPEFHKHMYRINKEAGTNITVYHNFHDEVRLYQQHWWRCNGPCQQRKPYFGMVRRTMNRAPGPNDRWWDEHARTCGGTFTKVKEPEKKAINQSKGKISQTKPVLGNIRNFVSVTKEKPSGIKPDENNIRGINNSITSTKNAKTSQIITSANIHGFTQLGTPQRPIINNGATKANVNSKVPKIGGGTALKSNSNSTIVVNGTTNASKTKTTTSESTDRTTPAFNGLGNRLSSLNRPKDNGDYSVVRNHWLNKFGSSTNKRDNSNGICVNSKKQKVVKEDAINIIDLDGIVNCPVCQRIMKESLLNNHLDTCLIEMKDATNNKNEICFVCNKEVPDSIYREHVDKCFDNNIDNNGDEDLTECEVCNVYFNKEKIEEHKKLCIEILFSGSTQSRFSFQDTSKSSSSSTPSELLSQCSVCDNFFESKQLNNHKEKCILNVFTDVEKKYNIPTTNEKVSCLVCGAKILKSELNVHLEDCMVHVFDESNDFVQDSGNDESVESHIKNNCDSANSGHNKYNCPFCMELYSELDMSGHLNACLSSDLDNSFNKTILIDSFSSDDV